MSILNKIIINGLIVLLFLSGTASARESDYSESWCREKGGVYERSDTRLEDEFGAIYAVYPDCIYENSVVEADWAHKWYEGIGQMFHYARVSGKDPELLLILKAESDERFVKRAEDLRDWFGSGAAKVPFKIHTIKAY